MCGSVHDWRESGNTDVGNMNSLPGLPLVCRVALSKHDSFQYASVASLSNKGILYLINLILKSSAC